MKYVQCKFDKKDNFFGDNGPKVAVVLPICDVEPYLESCLDSMLEQTYFNFQIFAVDDKSVDNSAAVLKKYSQQDERISAFYLKKRKGVSNARNLALEKIELEKRFDYVAFVDGDDIVVPNFLESLVKKAEENFSDITVCGYFNFYESNNNVEEVTYPSKQSLDQAEFIEHVFARARWSKDLGGGGMVWKNLFSSESIKGCRFPVDVKIVEDEVFSVCAATRSQRFSYIPSALYGHRDRGDSLSKRNDMNLERLKARLKSLEAGRDLPEESRLIILSAFADAFSKVCDSTVRLQSNQLKSYKQTLLRAKEEGLVQRKVFRRFILFLRPPLDFQGICEGEEYH